MSMGAATLYGAPGVHLGSSKLAESLREYRFFRLRSRIARVRPEGRFKALGGVSFVEFLGSRARVCVPNSTPGMGRGGGFASLCINQRPSFVINGFWPPLGRGRAFMPLPRHARERAQK